MARDPAYFQQLLHLLELERAAEKARSQELRETLPLAELEARGLVLLDVEVMEESVGLGGRFLLTLERADKRELPAPLHNGDLVELRPRRTEEVEPARGIVSRAQRARVQVALDRAPPPWVSEGRLRVDLVPNDVTFDRARSAVTRVQGLDKGQERRKREVLLGNEPPRFDKLREFEAVRPLNTEQTDAVARALACEDFFLVHGPPGTGKSHVLAEIAVQAVARGERVLATAASNAAVDHLL
ncbi:MAG TPA: AAA domain-containing protein, partial [Myxococcaceae bacterium]|nr:AAA domain-containing protein [Myxococcaceae bacterium]